MTLRHMPLIGAVLLMLSMATALADEHAPYPIWWSPELGLESLEQIDERLDRPLGPGEEGFRIFVGIGSNRRTEIAQSCADIRRLEKEASGEGKILKEEPIRQREISISRF